MKYSTNIQVKKSGDHFETTALVGDHVVIFDEPSSHGGTDKAPTPHQMLLSALGACIAITLRMYADRKQWDLKKIVIYLNMEKVNELSRDAGNPMNDEITKIYRKVEFGGDLSQEQLKRLEIISNKCPVHKTISGKILVEDFPS